MTQNIFKSCQELNPAQTWGLLALICIAQRETTTVEYQLNEWGFDDVPDELVNQIDGLGDSQHIEVIQGVLTNGFCGVDQAVYID